MYVQTAKRQWLGSNTIIGRLGYRPLLAKNMKVGGSWWGSEALTHFSNSCEMKIFDCTENDASRRRTR